MIYSATVKQAGTETGTWVVSPFYTRNDGKSAPDILALSANHIVPVVNDIVLCAESINPFDHSSVRSFDDNGGSNPVIIATFAELFTTLCDMVVKGKMTLGLGTNKMVLGDPTEIWAKNVDASIKALRTWGATGVAPSGGVVDLGGIAPFPQVPPYVEWSSSNLSQNHKLD